MGIITYYLSLLSTGDKITSFNLDAKNVFCRTTKDKPYFLYNVAIFCNYMSCKGFYVQKMC